MCYAVLDPGESREPSPPVLCIQVDGDDNTQKDREHQVMGALKACEAQRSGQATLPGWV